MIRIFALVLCVTILIATVFYPQKVSAVHTEYIVRIWNIDTFEGGKGSRTSFLKKVARLQEKEQVGVYYFVNSYTAEGANEAFSRGEIPDVICYGLGLDCVAEYALSLPYSFVGGEVNGECVAYPWCRGSYFLFTRNADEPSKKTVISCGGENMPEICAKLHAIDGEYEDSLTAYTDFLSGKYGALLGTQRDLCRFAVRNVTVNVQPLTNYCDLYAYVSILSQEKYEQSLAFVRRLLADEVQSTLGDIGMFSLYEKPYESQPITSTVSVFLSQTARKELKALCAKKEDEKKLNNFLKNI